VIEVARLDHPEVHEVVASAHCLNRFRERMPVRSPGRAEVVAGVVEALESADVSRMPPAWAVSDKPAELWAATADLAFPLARTDRGGRWLAVTCLRRDQAR
jgi:hypothetical protein